MAAQCPNTTSMSLSEALGCFPNLVFLDLSNTMATRDSLVLSKLGQMPGIQVLKLRQIGLRDEDLEIVAAAIKMRIRSLDIRGNALTDKGARILLRWCFKVTQEVDGLLEDTVQPGFGFSLDDWPSGIARPDLTLLDDFRSDALDDHFIKQLATPVVNRLPSEDLPETGITHLYISNNHLTIDGLTMLIKPKRLFVLDVGAVYRPQIAERPRSSFSYSQGEPEFHESLIPALAKYCSSTLTSLRIHYDVVAKTASSSESDILPVPFELPSQAARVELNGGGRIFELGSGEDAPRYELYGDSTHIVISPAIGERPVGSAEESLPIPNRGAAFAPEAVEPIENDDHPVLTATGLIYSAQAVNGINALPRSEIPEAENERLTYRTGTTELSIALINQQRSEFRRSLLDRPHSLLPSMLPRLRTLTLVDIPCKDLTRDVVDSLIRFIGYCAMEAEFARLHASAAQACETGNVGQERLLQIRNRARDIFALSQIVLEMGPPDSTNMAFKSKRTSQLVNFPYRTKSSTEDADSEALWSAQENDFSFFGENEECGLPAQEPRRHIPLSAALSEKLVVVPEEMQPELPASEHPPSNLVDQGLDVVQELAKFRKERKVAFEQALKQGKKFVDGYWPGEVKVVRWQAQKQGVIFSGNHSERGIYR